MSRRRSWSVRWSPPSTVGETELWQEYGILMIIPIVFVIYVVANALGKKTMPPKVAREVS
jgi:hypothetical protein